MAILAFCASTCCGLVLRNAEFCEGDIRKFKLFKLFPHFSCLSNTAMNICVQVFVDACFHFSSSRVAGCYGNSMVNIFF